MQLTPTTQDDLPLLAGFITEAAEWAPTSYGHLPSELILGQQETLWLKVLEGGQVIGACGFVGISWIDGSTELCLGVIPALRGKGYAKRVAREMNTYAHENLGLRRLVVRCTVDSPSVKIAQALGFKVEGVHKGARLRRGQRIDAVTLGLVKE